MKKNILIVIIINFFISLFFFLDHLNSGYTALSSDNNNIIPICYKKDNPGLFSNDLYLDRLENVRYYTPFYVDSLRTIHHIFRIDCLTSLKILFFITHFIFGVAWFLLFYKLYQEFWIALFLSILIRGIVWLPGMEMWGISDLWTMMPRTVYGALMPIPFLFFNFQNKYGLFLSAFLIGLIFNFHPITGLGGILIYLVILYYAFFLKKIFLSIFILNHFFILMGMLPFIINYFHHTPVNSFDKELFYEAFYMRIPGYFANPVKFISLWFNFRYLFFIVPVITLWFISIKKNKFRNESILILVAIFFLFVFPNLSVFVESFINDKFDLMLRMSFQLIRIQKLIILAGYVSLGYILLYFYRDFNGGKLIVKTIIFSYFILLFFVKLPLFNHIPFLGDDISRTILPNKLSFGRLNYVYGNKDLENILEYIKVHTPDTAVFVGPFTIRAAAKRSVQFDSKGASMLIEGNPQKLIRWYKDKKKLESFDLKQKWNFYFKHQVSYWLTSDSIPTKAYIYKKGNWKLYKINGPY